jgi:hypothetical protein
MFHPQSPPIFCIRVSLAQAEFYHALTVQTPVLTLEVFRANYLSSIFLNLMVIILDYSNQDVRTTLTCML